MLYDMFSEKKLLNSVVLLVKYVETALVFDCFFLLEKHSLLHTHRYEFAQWQF
jgi:hypothetical protein